MPERWVRFHSLPQSKRYPTSPREHAEVLRRYNAVLTAVLGESRSAPIYLVTVEYGARASVPGESGPGACATAGEPIHVGLHPDAVWWMQATDPDDPEMVYGIHVSRRVFTRGNLDDLLGYVSEDRASDVVVADDSLHWLFAPYDGGMDVIAPSVAQRDRLAARFSEWLSQRPDGL